MDPCPGGNSRVLHNNSFNKGARGSPACLLLPHPASQHFFFFIFSISFFLPVSPPKMSPSPYFHSRVSSSFPLSSRPLPSAGPGGGGGGGGGKIGRVPSSPPQKTAINPHGPKPGPPLNLKNWVPLDKPTDLHIYRGRGSERASERGRGARAAEQKGTSAAKLSLNIISRSLVHYLFNKLLRAERAARGQEVTHYAFFFFF